MSKAPSRYYVYELVDPRDGTAFYVGKGKGRRAWKHAREWKRGAGCNVRKLDRIAEIHAAGTEIIIRVVADGMSEEAAYALERRLISEQRAALTNVLMGQFSRPEIALAHTNDMLRRLRRPAAWFRRFAKTNGRAPTRGEIQLYAKVAQLLVVNRQMIEASMAKT